MEWRSSSADEGGRRRLVVVVFECTLRSSLRNMAVVTQDKCWPGPSLGSISETLAPIHPSHYYRVICFMASTVANALVVFFLSFFLSSSPRRNFSVARRIGIPFNGPREQGIFPTFSHGPFSFILSFKPTTTPRRTIIGPVSSIGDWLQLIPDNSAQHLRSVVLYTTVAKEKRWRSSSLVLACPIVADL